MELSVPKPVQQASGRWRAQLMQDGKRISISAETEQEYYIKARAIKAGMIEQKQTAPKMTVGKAIDEYIESKDNLLSPATVKGYKSIRKNRFQKLMDRDIRSGINWQKAINDEAGGGIGAKSVRNAWSLIEAAVLAQGVELPAVTLPRKVKAERPWLDYEQIEVFLNAIKGKKCELACLLALHSLRMSEILALKHDSLKDGIIRIRGAVVINDAGEYVYKETNKTARSRRDVPVMIPRLAEIWPAGDPQFQKHAAINEMVGAICEKAGLPKITMHSLRHSFASLAWHLRWDMMTTCRVGGWSTPATVQGIYTHLAGQDLNESISRMKEFYEKGKDSITLEITQKQDGPA
jgi:integrase